MQNNTQSVFQLTMYTSGVTIIFPLLWLKCYNMLSDKGAHETHQTEAIEKEN